MELLKVSSSAGLLPSSQTACIVPSSPTAGLCSFTQLNLPVAPSSIFHGLHFYSKKSDGERLLGNFQRLRTIQCNAPVITRTYFSRVKMVGLFDNQIQVDTKLLAAWLPRGKSPGRMDGELESLTKSFFPCESRAKFASWVCFAKGPRPRNPRVWKSRPRIGTVSKSHKLVEHVKALSNVKEEVYGALDAFIAWEVEFPLITIKKALKTLEAEKEWKRIIQITKWMLSKGQGKTMGNYYLLLNALAEERRIEEAEELWMQIFRRHLECVPKMFFTRVISMYEQNNMTDKLIEIFADMEELGVKPEHLAVTIVAKAFKNLGMIDKYEKLLKKYPQTNWEYHVCKGYRYRVPVQTSQNFEENMMQHRQ